MTYRIVASKYWTPAEGLSLEEAETVKATLEAEEIGVDWQSDGITTYEIVEEE